MSVEHIEILVEEPSMEASLRIMLPNIVGSITFAIYTYQCKDDLLLRLPARLRGYANWLPASWRILVIVDRDDDDCSELKKRLETIAQDAGLSTRTQVGACDYAVVNRVAIEELEAWYFGDWQAVCAAYPKVPIDIHNKAPFRNPDAIAGGTWEAFERVLQRAGYFSGGLRKIEAARAITPHLQPSRSISHSFKVFYDVLHEMVAC